MAICNDPIVFDIKKDGSIEAECKVCHAKETLAPEFTISKKGAADPDSFTKKDFETLNSYAKPFYFKHRVCKLQ